MLLPVVTHKKKLLAIFHWRRDDASGPTVVTTTMGSTHFSPEPILPSLHPLPPTDASNTTSDPIPSLPVVVVSGPSDNGLTTEMVCFSSSPRADWGGEIGGDSGTAPSTQSRSPSLITWTTCLIFLYSLKGPGMHHRGLLVPNRAAAGDRQKPSHQ